MYGHHHLPQGPGDPTKMVNLFTDHTWLTQALSRVLWKSSVSFTTPTRNCIVVPATHSWTALTKLQEVHQRLSP